MTTWPQNWTRIPTLRLRNAALRNAEQAAAECARRRAEREEVDAYLSEHARSSRRLPSDPGGVFTI